MTVSYIHNKYIIHEGWSNVNTTPERNSMNKVNKTIFLDSLYSDNGLKSIILNKEIGKN